MAEAIISALSKSRTQNMADIVVYVINKERIKHLMDTYSIQSCDNIEDGILAADVTLLSVKPQNVESVATAITKAPKGLILSIVAGCTIDQLKEVFKTNNIVRSMPNTPAMVMEAMTVWVATKETPKELVGESTSMWTLFAPYKSMNWWDFNDRYDHHTFFYGLSQMSLF